jgi:PEP-CTERM motif
MRTPFNTWASPLALATIAALCGEAAAATSGIQLVANTLNIFRDTRGSNDLNINPGDRVQFGADIVGGSAGVALGYRYDATGFASDPFPCSPLTVNPNICSRSPAFSTNRMGAWTLNFVRGSDTLAVQTPTLLGAEEKVPFPVSVSVTGGGTMPTLSWQIPGGFAPDGIRVNIFDKSRINPQTGAVDIIHSVAVDPRTGHYTLPSVLSSGLSLAQGGNYAINYQLIETRGHVPFTNNNAQILRRSNSYFNFTPLGTDAPPNVYLPTVNNGVYNFDVQNVGPGSVTFIDPFVAVGYDYAIGAGDPNFQSVLLPNVGDGQFTLDYDSISGHHSVTLAHGTQYFFADGGVSAFKVGGIETSANLDPNNVTAFVTGLTFDKAGKFTGTMTPQTVFIPGVPEPSTYALMLTGLGLCVGMARRRRANAG